VRTCLRADRVLERDSLLLDGAADLADELLDAIEAELERYGLESTSRWTRVLASLAPRGRQEVREFLVVNHRGLKDLAHWVGCRPAGIHLEVLMMTTISPSWFKRRLSALLFAGEWWRLSMPRGLAQEEAIRIWLTALHEAVSGSAKTLVRQLAGANVAIVPAAHDPLGEW
jgi:hypothetical protein